MRIYWVLFMIFMITALTGCNLGNNQRVQPTSNVLETATPAGVPTIRMMSPMDGDEFVAGEEILVSVEATDSIGVTRVQLLANNQIVKSVSSESLQGDVSMSAILDYTPQLEGSVTLRVLAFRGAISSEPDQIQVSIRNTVAEVIATPAQISNVPVIPNDGVCRALVSVGLNFRTGPSTDYERIQVLNSGTLAPIVGRVGDNSWWKLNVNNQEGWVSSEYTTEFGNCGNVPVVSVVPTALPATDVPLATDAPTLTPMSMATATQDNGAVVGQPDLLVADVMGDRSVVIPPNATSITETYTIRIQNMGTAPTGQFVTSLYVNGVARDLGVIAELDANTGYTFDVPIEFTQSGIYDLVVAVDTDDQVDEISEVNNRGQLSVTVGR